MSLNILNRINHGYDHLEPVILGLMAMNHSFMLIGRHGTGKTRMARELSKGFGQDGFVFYDATKDDLISIAGIPDPEAIKSGELRFVPHQRSIWGKSTIVIDEITRAGKESQNLWLEILEERACFGLKLSYRTLIATANPESYAAAFQLDEALLDRFYAVVPVPELQESVSNIDVSAMVKLASSVQTTLEPEEIARVFAEIQNAHESLEKEGAPDLISRYLSRFVPALLKTVRVNNGPYISPRTYARNLPATIMALAAYHRVAGSGEPLQLAAMESLRYAIATKLDIKPATLGQIHSSIKNLLRSTDLPEGERIRLEISDLGSFEKRRKYLQEHWKDVTAVLEADEIEKVLGEMLRGTSRRGEKEKLVALKQLLDSLGYEGDALRQVDGRLLIALNAAINHITPKLNQVTEQQARDLKCKRAFANINRFRELLAAGKFLNSKSEDALKLKTFLIDVNEGDIPGDTGTLIRFFDGLDFAQA